MVASSAFPTGTSMRNLAAGSSRNHAEEIVRDAAVAEADEAGESNGAAAGMPGRAG